MLFSTLVVETGLNTKITYFLGGADSSSGKTNSSSVLFPSPPQLVLPADVGKQQHLYAHL